MNGHQIWDSLSRNQKNLAGLSAVLFIASIAFGAIKAVDPYLPGSLRQSILDERAARAAADDSSRADRRELRNSVLAVLDGQRELINALGLAVDVLSAPRSPEGVEARRRLRKMQKRKFELHDGGTP